jgi:hypothetical protein
MQVELIFKIMNRNQEPNQLEKKMLREFPKRCRFCGVKLTEQNSVPDKYKRKYMMAGLCCKLCRNPLIRFSIASKIIREILLDINFPEEYID